MKYLLMAVRFLLALVFIVFGFEKLHDFMHPPMPPADSMIAKYMVVMMGSGYFKAIGVFEMLGGLLLLPGRTTPLALCILCPITVNILLFVFTVGGGQGYWPGIAVAAFELLLIYGYRGSFAGILSFAAKPTA